MGSRRTNLGTVLIGAFLLGTGALAVGMALHWSGGGRLLPWTGYISELSVGARRAGDAFLVMIVGLAVLTGIFFAFVSTIFRKRDGRPLVIVRAASVLGIAGAIALVEMAFFPLDPSRPSVYAIHQVIAVATFFLVAAQLGTLTPVLARVKLQLPATLAAVTSVLALAFAVLALLTEVLDMMPASPVTYLIQWTTFLLYGLWLLTTGVALRRRGARARANDRDD